MGIRQKQSGKFVYVNLNKIIIKTMSKKRWIYDSPKPPKEKISEIAKMEIKEKCDEFIKHKLKPKSVKPFDRKNKKESQIVDIYCKWSGTLFYL